MKFASLFAALTTANECGPEVVTDDAYFPTEFRASTSTGLSHAIYFDITYGSNFKILNNHQAKEQYVLTQCNTEKPKEAAVNATKPLEAGFKRKYFTIPLQTFGSDTSGNQGFFNELGVNDRQTFMSEYVFAPCMQKAFGCVEAMLAENAEHLCNETSCIVQDPTELKLEQIESTDGYFRDYAQDHAKTIAVHAYADPHMLNTVEWVKFVAAFFNLEDVAQKHMDAQVKKWEEATAGVTAPATPPLVVLGVTGGWFQLDDGNWACCENHISLPNYFTTMVTAAGGRSYTLEDFSSNPHVMTIRGCDTPDTCVNPKIAFNASDPAAMTSFREALLAAHVIVDYTYSYDTKNYKKSDFAAAYGFAEDAVPSRVYRLDGLLNANNGMDWFQGAKVRPSVVVDDMVAAIHETGGKRTYFRTLDETPTVLTAADCEKELPVCNDDVEAAPLEAPCEKYQVCVEVQDLIDASNVVPATTTESVAVAAGLLMAAAAYA